MVLSRLKEKKESLSEAELREAGSGFRMIHTRVSRGHWTECLQVRREYALPPQEGRHFPNKSAEASACFEGWTILDFLEQMKFGDGAEDVANLFE